MARLHLRPLSNVTPRMIWQAATAPAVLRARWSAPEPVDVLEAGARLFGGTKSDLRALLKQFLQNGEFFTELNSNLAEQRTRHAELRWQQFAYLAVRLLRPRVTVETGVFDGDSSAAILLALKDNGVGTLYSIDKPAIEVVPGSTETIGRLPAGLQPGWAVPSGLKSAWKLFLGDAKRLLPQILSALDGIDVFIHDSLHMEEHMRFEYETVWPCLRSGGLICSDDVFTPKAGAAWTDFCRKHGLAWVNLAGGFAAARKP